VTEHKHTEGASGCLITKDEAAGLANVGPRTIERWASAELIQKFTKGPAGYWVRFCREEVQAAVQPRPAGGR
jgi:hypothetical protein